MKPTAIVATGLGLLASCSGQRPFTSDQPLGSAAVAYRPALSRPLPADVARPRFLRQPALAAQQRQRGLQLRQGGDFTAAIAALHTAVALDPTHADGHVLLGWTQHLSGDGQGAEASLQGLLTEQPEHLPALNALGIVQLVAGDLPQAVATHQRALALKPDNEIAHYNLSLAYQRLDQGDQAIAHAQAAARLEPSNPHPLVALALAHWSRGDRSQAVVAYGQALALDGRYRQGSYLDHLLQAGFSPAQVETTAAIRQASL